MSCFDPLIDLFCRFLQNEMLRQRLRVEQDELRGERRRREEGVAALTRETIALKHATRHLSAATFHATSCRNRRRCSICMYARRTLADVDSYHDKYVKTTKEFSFQEERITKILLQFARANLCKYSKANVTFPQNKYYFRNFVGCSGNLLQCLQAPLQDIRSWLRPSATSSSANSSRVPRLDSSVADREICYIDDSSVDSSSNGSTNSRSCSSSTSSSNSGYDDEAYPSTPIAEPSLSSATSSVPHTNRAFSSDSGFVLFEKKNIIRIITSCSNIEYTNFFKSLFRFSSEIGDRRSRCFDNSSGKSRNMSESLDGNDDDQGASGRDGLTRSRWTSSFRRLLGRKSKSKLDRFSGAGKTDESH